MDTNRVIVYSLLAHINNSLSNKSIKDLSDIFVPLVKRVISKLWFIISFYIIEFLVLIFCTINL